MIGYGGYDDFARGWEEFFLWQNFSIFVYLKDCFKMRKRNGKL